MFVCMYVCVFTTGLMEMWDNAYIHMYLPRHGSMNYLSY